MYTDFLVSFKFTFIKIVLEVKERNKSVGKINCENYCRFMYLNTNKLMNFVIFSGYY